METKNLVGKNHSEVYTKNLVGKNQPVGITYCVLWSVFQAWGYAGAVLWVFMFIFKLKYFQTSRHGGMYF